MKRKAIVAGATGLVGQELIKFLLAEPAYDSVVALVRRTLGINHPKLREIILNFDKIELIDVNFAGADVFCALGTTIKKAGSKEEFRKVDYHYPLMLANIAKSQDAEQFLIVTAMGANSKSKIFYNKVKGEVENALKGLDLPALHIFRPSLLLGKRGEFRLGEMISSIIMRILTPLFSGPLLKYRAIRASLVAKYMIFTALKNMAGIHIHTSADMQQHK